MVLIPQCLCIRALCHRYPCPLASQILHQQADEEQERELLKDVLSVLHKTYADVLNTLSGQDWLTRAPIRLANFLKTPVSGSILTDEEKAQLDDVVRRSQQQAQATDCPIKLADFVTRKLSRALFLYAKNTIFRLMKFWHLRLMSYVCQCE